MVEPYHHRMSTRLRRLPGQLLLALTNAILGDWRRR